MTHKVFVIRLLLLAVSLTGAVLAHTYMQDKVYDEAWKKAEQSGTPYSPLTEKEAVERVIAECNRDSGYVAYLRIYGTNCSEDVTKNGNEKISSEIRKHRYDYTVKHVAPYTKELEHRNDVIFGAVYVILAFLGIHALLKWFFSQALPAIRIRTQKLNETTSIPSNIKNISANRKLRQAQKDFETVKNLYENGLITEDMFLKRKSELVTALGDNTLLRS